MARAEEQGLEKTFKLKSTLSTSNMVLFDHEAKIAKYSSPLDILKDFCKLRRQVYEKRKAHLVAKITRDKEILSNKARFILMVVKGELELRKRKKVDLLKELQKRGFKPMSELDALVEKKKNSPTEEPLPTEEDAEGESSEGAGAEKSDYDYLLGMNLWSLTFEKVEEIKKQLETKEKELSVLKATSIEAMWDRDLVALSQGLDELEALEAEEAEKAAEAVDGRRKKAGAREAAAGAKRKAAPKAASRKRSVDDSIDEALMSRPLQDGAGLDEDGGTKQSWGVGAPQTRKAAPSPERPRGEPDLPSTQDAGPKGKGRKARRESSRPPENVGSSVAKSEEPQPEEPQEDVGGASLLSRLLKSKAADTPGSTRSLGSSLAVPSSGFSALGGSDDFFSYLSAGQDSSKPYDALDFGAPPCGDSVGSSFSVAEPTVDEQPAKQPKGRGRGRGKGKGRGAVVAEDSQESGTGQENSADGAEERVDAGRQPKRRKKDTGE